MGISRDGKCPMRVALWEACRVDGEGVLIWSIGEDLTDDGGTPIDPAKGVPRKGDIVWKLRIPGAPAPAESPTTAPALGR